MIECLRLTGFNRFGLALINEIEITFTDVIQIILGRNGCGKSSLLGQLSPLPGEHIDFVKGGGKYIRVLFKGVRYELSSSFPKGGGHTGYHSFRIMDTDEELNKGGTFAIQKELVMHYFNLNKERLQVLLGVEKFSQMSPKKRQDWLTLLSPVSLDYAFDVYQHLKTLKRDTDGVVRHHQERLTKESRDVPTDGEQQSVKRELDHFLESVEQLTRLQYRLPDDHHQAITLPSLETDLKRIVSNAKRLLKTHPALPRALDLRDRESFSALIERRQHDIAKVDGILEHWVQEYHTLQDKQPSQEVQLNDEKIAQLRQAVTDLTQTRDQLADTLTPPSTFFTVPDIELGQHPGMSERLSEVERELTQLCQQLPDNRDQRLSRVTFEAAKEENRQAKDAQRYAEQRRDAILARQQMLKTCRSITCPSCHHDFRPGVDEEEPARLDAELDTHATTIDNCEAVLKRTQAFIEEVEAYQHLLHRYRQLTQNYGFLAPLWATLSEHKVIVGAPSHHLTGIHDFFHYLRQRVAYQDVLGQLDLTQHQLRYVDALDPQTQERLEARLKEIETTIEHYTQRRRQLIQHVDQLTQYRDQVDDVVAQSRVVDEALQQLMVNVDHYLQRAFRDVLSKEMRETQLQLADIKRRLHDIDVKRGILTDLEEQLRLSQQSQDDWKLLVKAMCPKDGLLGRYLRGFMQNVVTFMNAVIDRVWTYELEVLPSKVDKDKLDYRFPLLIEKGRTAAPDIKDGSGSQIDIVDFAFRLMFRKYLGLEGFPLYFDEFGITFDEEHRTNLSQLLTSMVENGQITQVFYISHYLQEHTALSNAEVCVIDPHNITVPKVYNQHVRLS